MNYFGFAFGLFRSIWKYYVSLKYYEIHRSDGNLIRSRYSRPIVRNTSNFSCDLLLAEGISRTLSRLREDELRRHRYIAVGIIDG